MIISCAILTVSDRCSSGLAIDKSGPQLSEFVQRQSSQTTTFTVISTHLVPDSIVDIQDFIKNSKAQLILTTGGTGFGVRDVTSEAVEKLIQKNASGLTVAMITASLKITPLAALSRPVCGVYNKSLIIALPGSPKAALENLSAIIDVLPHALELIKGDPEAGESFHKELSKDKANPSNVSAEHISGHSRGHQCVRHRRDNDLNPTGNFLSNDPQAAVSSRARHSKFPIISYDDALSLVLEHSTPLENVFVHISELTGYVLASTICSSVNIPSFRASIVDGYAMRHSEIPQIYKVQSASTAGGHQIAGLEFGNVMRITTGAKVPDGASCVAMVEDTDIVETDSKNGEELSIKILQPVKDGECIREIGSDIMIGEVLFDEGHLVAPSGGEIGVLASIGLENIEVVRKPVIGFLSTGNELGQDGGIRDSNRPALLSVCKAHMFQAVDLGIVKDDIDALAKSLEDGICKADVIVTTGGVSMGELDLLKPCLERNLGAKIHFGRVLIKPGKPVTFATCERNGKKTLIFSLPGNPVSALVTFQLFVLPALMRMKGVRKEMCCKPVVRVKVFNLFLTYKLSHKIELDSRPEFFRVALSRCIGEDLWVATGTGEQRSSRVGSMTGAMALLKLPGITSELTAFDKGAVVDAIWL